MKDLFKKNQIMITVLAIMLCIAGYLTFSGRNDAQEAGSSAVVDETDGTGEANLGVSDSSVAIVDEMAAKYDLTGLLEISEEDIESASIEDIQSLDTDIGSDEEDYSVQLTEEQIELLGEETYEDEVPGEAVFTSGQSVTSLLSVKLSKEQTRAKNKETLTDIINNTALTDDSKKEAIASLVEMTQVSEMETACEVLINAKGFYDVMVVINDSGADVIIAATELDDAQRAQIEDIVIRKTGMKGENIAISCFKGQ